MRHVKHWATTIGLTLTLAAPTHAQDRVFVNGARVTQAEFATALARVGLPLPSPVPDGTYWYDRMSGLWGVEGGPTMGQIPPGLPIGGELRSDASGGLSDVFINGRALHPQEVVFLQQLFGVVVPGRYWMNAQGVGGLEGGPPVFNLVAAAQAAQAARGGSYTSRGLFGSGGSDGTCSYYLHPGGSSVMTGC